MTDKEKLDRLIIEMLGIIEGEKSPSGNITEQGRRFRIAMRDALGCEVEIVRDIKAVNTHGFRVIMKED